MDIQAILQQAKAEKETYQKWIKKAAKANKRLLDDQFHSTHTAVFKKMDCLTCANCCKTTSPIFRDVDIKRIAKRLRVSERQLIDSYLKMDDENDYVLQSSPCTFLGDDNKCSIYEDRPLACREYPHTDRKNMHQILPLTRKNMEVCPAVAKIVEEVCKKIT